MTWPVCPYCGANSPVSCEYEDQTGIPASCAPCQEDDGWDQPDPDRMREDRDDRRLNNDHEDDCA